MPRLKRYKKGAITTDSNGVRWYIERVLFANGKPKYVLLREGSLAHQIATGGGKDEERGG